MKKHIVVTAFGTRHSVSSNYNHIDSAIKSEFPDSELHWHFSSPAVNQPFSLVNILQKLGREPENKIVVQSLYVSPGREFHQTVKKITSSSVPAAIGMPLLTSPQDHFRVAGAIAPLIKGEKTEATLILGHGTHHPSWTTLPAFEQIIRKTVGNNVFVAALEKYPSSDHIIDEIAADGFSSVQVIPLLIASGIHVRRDITGSKSDSWFNRLKAKNISPTIYEEGLGRLDTIAKIFCDHIRQALCSLTK